MPRGIPKNKPGQGRPTRKTPEVIEILKDCFSRGLHIKTACQLAMIEESTYHRWVAADKDFASQMNYVRATKIKDLHARIEADDPKFIAKNLEPSLYRDRIEQEVSGKNGEPIKLVIEDYRGTEDKK